MPEYRCGLPTAKSKGRSLRKKKGILNLVGSGCLEQREFLYFISSQMAFEKRMGSSTERPSISSA